MNSVNPMNVMKLLEEDYKQLFQLDGQPSEADKQLKELVKEFMDVKINRSGSSSLALEEDLQYELQTDMQTFDEFEKLVANQLAEPDENPSQEDKVEPLSSGTEPSSNEFHVPRIPNPKQPPRNAVTLDYKKRSVAFWRNVATKKRRSLSCVQTKFKKVTSIRQLQEWERHVAEGGSRYDKLKALRLETGKQFFLAKQKPHIVKDMDIRRWAVTANRTIGLVGFTASPDSVGKLKRYYGIVHRKITKFVTDKYIQEAPQVKKTGEECVALVRSRISDYGLDCMWNTDQPGFDYEMRPVRTLHLAGANHALAICQSENSMTHSYTVMMTISPGTRKFLPQLWITLQKGKGVFGPIVARTMFKADNLYVTASASGKMTKKLYLEWGEKILFSHVEDRCILLADSWRTYSDQEAVLEFKPEELEYEMITIPPKVTGDIQPLDRLFVRMYKDFFRKISSFIILHSLPLQVHHRDVILKMHSLVYQQFQSPRFGDLVNQAWHLCGYTDESFDYVNPTEFAFPKKLTGHCDHENCDDRLLLKCGWCKAPLCFHHFYDQYHVCKIYLP
ncbi:hypothetical protein RvY_03707 [Ramazzottius varieornatus]|uniref:Transposase Tc5 C-terminal domain-containing protein n=1 Tax=Ramazzottius varieornatus TaxID=947166 RepID=A0A1D1UP04_RAMVA|nr:hypothetical protein RvY_03707 [Ramazzottius varieornatus]